VLREAACGASLAGDGAAGVSCPVMVAALNRAGKDKRNAKAPRKPASKAAAVHAPKATAAAKGE
jgi:hypothetical protein